MGRYLVNINYLYYFVEIADQKSINKAAKKLFLNRSSLNVALSALENELGFPLLYRSVKGVELTPNGKIIYDDCKNILKTIKKWHTLDFADKITIRLFLVPAINLVYSVSLLSNFRESYHSYDFHCREISNSIGSIQSALSEDNAMILGGYYTRDRKHLYALAEKYNYEIKELFSSKFVAYMNINNSYANLDNITWDHINTMDQIMLNDLEASPFMDKINLDSFNTATSIPIILEYLKSNINAVAILPKLLEKRLRLLESGIVSSDILCSDLQMNYYLIFKKKMLERNNIAVFVDYVTKYPFVD